MKICLVSNEILGAHKNGGIGTATSNLAVLLADNGHEVTLFYVGESSLDPLDRWAIFYRVTNITVIHFPGSSARISPKWMKQPVQIFEQLRARNFDFILFQDWMGLGHACIIAKKAGLYFKDTVLAIVTHSSTAWLLEANRTFPKTPEHLALQHMERQAIELADAVVSPSEYLKQWMTNSNWKLPDCSVIPYFLDGEEILDSDSGSSMSMEVIEKPNHVIFFGRLEERKGIQIFLSALTSTELTPFKFGITFLGRSATMSEQEVRKFVELSRPDLMADLSVYADFSSHEAVNYIKNGNGVAVIPSLIDNSPCVIYEVLKHRVPFIASASGGIPELVHPNDADRILFSPNKFALANKIREVLTSKDWKAACAAYQQSELGSRWLDWFEERRLCNTFKSSDTFKARAGVAQIPDTTVIVTHHERPHLLQQNLAALAAQSDMAFDVVVVDDGSKTEKAVDCLDALEKNFAGLRLKVVRQDNRYLGAARNNGLKHTDTPYVIFLDDDNVPFPNMIEVFRNVVHSSSADIVTCQMQFFHDADLQPDPRLLVDGERWAFPGGSLALGIIQNCFGDATAIYRRQVFDKVGVFHEIHSVTYEDWQLHLRACLGDFTLLSLPLPLFWYRVTKESMVRTTESYSNRRVISSTLRDKIPEEFSSLIDLVVGMNTN